MPAKLMILLIRFYQKCISRLKPVPTCRFTPTCSQYAIDALREWGVIRGVPLIVWRILRCNPFSRGGADPVPPNKRRRARLERKNKTESNLS